MYFPYQWETQSGRWAGIADSTSQIHLSKTVHGECLKPNILAAHRVTKQILL